MMEREQLTLANVYAELKRLEKALQYKGILTDTELADETLLGEDWLSQEDEEAWSDL